MFRLTLSTFVLAAIYIGLRNHFTDRDGSGLGWNHNSISPVLPHDPTDLSSLGPVGTVEWYKCEEEGVLPGAECGHIVVPLDYFDGSAGVAKVALGRYNATRSPRKGIVLMNPGGPGGSGVPLATVRGADLQAVVTGEEYDLIGFDPRGIGKTLPSTDCFETATRRGLFRHNTLLERGFQSPSNFSDPRTRDFLIYQQQEAEALYRSQFALCAQTIGDKLKYMGTSTVVRDIDFITRKLEGEDTPINFWGASYGTILGQYLINMLPDRLGRVVIDGVADAVPWSTEPPYKWYRTWLSNTTDAYNMFLEGCFEAGPAGCALATPNDKGPANIQHRLEAWIDDLFLNPMSVPNATIPAILTSAQASKFLFTTLQRPTAWPSGAQTLSAAISGNATALLESAYSRLFYSDLQRSAVSCNDQPRFPPPKSEDVADEALYVLQHVTRFGMDVYTLEPDSGCEFWPVTPPERFDGPWNKTLSNPVLIHSNLADPVTPIVNGRNVYSRLGPDNARLAVQNSAGHCSISSPSLCSSDVTRAFFADGTLPSQEHVCEIDVQPFPGSKEMKVYSMEDKMKLEQMVRVAETMNVLRSGGIIA